MKPGLTRRQFIQHGAATALAAATFPSLAPATAFGAEGRASAGNRIAVGCIGVGPQGRGVMGGFLPQSDVQVVAVCDVAKRNLDKALAQVNKHYKNEDCKACGDFRELLARPDLDAVLIATPDHWHVPVAIAAARAGKDMYVEKPLGLSVEEDQMLRKVCQQRKRIFQFGTQQRSSREFRKACELVRNGRIGKLQQINVWCVGSRPGGSTKPAPVPEGLDYESWLGPAPDAPYTDGKCFDDLPPGTWKTWWYTYDYALGFIAGWGVHPLDIAYWGHPDMMNGVLEIEGKGLLPEEGACNTAAAWDLNFTCADGVRMRYKATRNGCEANALNDFTEWQSRYGKIADHGTAFEGTDGWVEVHRGGLQTQPETLAEEPLGPNDKPLPKSAGHQRNFIESVKSRQPAICPIEDAVQADILCHLSDLAARLDRKLKWDPRQERFLDDKEANQKLARRPMRAAWRWS